MRRSKWIVLPTAWLLLSTGLHAETTITSAPNIRLEAGDPSNFEVTPSVEQEGMIAEGNPIRLIFSNASEGIRIKGVDLLPSSWVGPYQLDVSAEDSTGRTDKTVSFSYAPIRAKVDLQKNGIIWIPSTKTALGNNQTQYALYTQKLMSELPAQYTGSYALKAAIKEGSDVGLRVNNTSVLPGRRPVAIGAYNFDVEDGRINLPIAAFGEDDAGKGTLLVAIDRPGAPVVEVEYKVWKPSYSLQAATSSVIQGADKLEVTATPSPTNFCGLAANYSDAASFDVFTQPKCLVEWDIAGTPMTTTGSALQISKRVYQAGSLNVGLNAYVVNKDGTKVLVKREQLPVIVQNAADVVGFGFRNPPKDAIERIVEETTFEVIQEKGPSCTFYGSEGEAQDAASSRMACILKWDHIPEGLTEQTNTFYPSLNGFFTTQSDQENIGFSVYMVSEAGIKTLISQKTFNIDLINPRMPNIEFSPTVEKYGEVLAVQAGQNSIGYLTAKDIKSKLVISAKNGDGSSLLNSQIDLAYGRTISLQRISVPAPMNIVGKVDVIMLGAQYDKLPAARYEDFKTIVATPDYRVRPELTASESQALNTESMQVTVAISDGQNTKYDAQTMGQWEVRVLERTGIGDFKEISNWTAIDNEGKASFDLDLSTYEAGALRLTAEARLKLSTSIGQDIVRESLRFLAIEILDGKGVEGALSTRKIAGPAPLSTVIDFRPDDYKDRRALGKTAFEVSNDGGINWTDYASAKGSTRLIQTFPEGTYLVRATVANANSGVLTTTEPIEIVAFKIPEIDVQGADIAFEGETVTADINVTFKGEKLSPAEYILEKSEDRRKTWSTVSSASENLSSEESTTITTYYRVRHVDAPADNRYSWADTVHRVSFRRPKPPRVQISGESRIEIGEPYEFRAAISAPYHGLERHYAGEWTMPDGSKQYGDTVTYIPTEQDLDIRQLELSYRAWMPEYPDQVGQDTQRLFLWQYQWPTWRLGIDRKSYYPPAIVEIRAKTLGTKPSLEGPRYQWTLPTGVSVERDSIEDLRILKVNTTGTFTTGLTIADARGNESTIEGTFEILPVPPIELDLRMRAGNEYYREPLDVGLDTIMRGGHPDDRPLSYKYFVDGILVSENDRPRQTTTIMAGNHNVSVEVNTEFGQIVRQTQQIEVFANQAPVCELKGDMFSTSYSYKAYCQDQDGMIAYYRWIIDGQVIDNVRGYRLTTPRADYQSVPTVTVIAIDDVGAESEAITLSAPQN